MNMSHEAPAAFHASAVRPGAFGLVREAFDEVRSRRRLIRYLARADLKKTGADTVFGNLWWILDPILQMIVYVVLVTLIFRRSQPDFPLFIFGAIVPWKWFTSSISEAITSVSGQDRLIKQIKFPKIALPAATVVSGIVQFGFGLLTLAGMLVLLYPERITVTLLLIPLIAAVQLVFTMALALVLAALNVFFRDVVNLARHAMRLWFYLSPALYGAALVQELGQTQPLLAQLMKLNPFFTILEAYRSAIYFGTVPDFAALAVVLLVSVALLALGAIVFKQLEPSFAKVL
jgi:ABC-type polysaccharide/polyol phosphate export permease